MLAEILFPSRSALLLWRRLTPLSRAKAMTREAYVDMAISAQLHRDKVEDWNNQYIAACKRAEDMRLPTPIREHFYATNGWIIHED